VRIGRLAVLLIPALTGISALAVQSQSREREAFPVFAPLPDRASSENAAVALGRDLFFDRRLSRSMKHNCASCHDLATNGATSAPLDRSDAGWQMEFNTPTVFNSSYHYCFGWRGQNTEIGAQILRSLKRGLGGADGLAARRLAEDPAMEARFRAVYGGNPTEQHLIDALVAFTRTLVTPDAPFDRWLRGDAGAMTPQQIRGYTQFKSLGCVNCHQGRNIGANLIARRGLFNSLGSADPPHMRVPSLRNVAVTAPYFHDASSTTLQSAIRRMARAQLGLTLSDTEVQDMVAFLEALTGSYQGKHLRPAPDPQK
jgi:cytochrome c peroxidase